MADLSEAVESLRHDWSLDFTRVSGILARLSDPASLGDLVAVSGLPRRDVESVLAVLEPFLKSDGGRHSLAEPALLSSGEWSPGTTEARWDQHTLADRMAGLAAGLPPSRWRLDHVPATPATMAGRALYLAGEYELDGASLLCLGDHDLTSLAIGSVAPGAELTAVDIDEPILDHIGDSAAGLGVEVTTAWADLRLALPPSLSGSADLVFTDPPYTTGGMRLFLVRALEALRPTGHERIAFCFGTGERHLVKALEVQGMLGELRLALEAMLPGFNRYAGGEAIGARSDLYICRPTTGARVGEPARSRSGRRSRSGTGDARIYSRGPSALESSDRALPEAVARAALQAAGDGPQLLVGEGWDGPAVSLPDFFARVAAWATAARPGPFPYTGTPLINTHPDYGAAARRTLLLAAPERMVLILPRRHLDDLALPLIEVAYDIATVPTGPGGDPAVVRAVRHDRAPADEGHAVLRHIVLHPGAKVANAWRDGLLAVARAADRPMTKNDARAGIAAASAQAPVHRLRLWELPASTLRNLTGVIIPL